MAGLTKQDIEILMRGVELWERPDMEAIAKEVIGCTCPVCNPTPEALVDRIMAKKPELTKRLCEEVSTRKERSIILRSKLIALRDGIVADEVFDDAAKSQNCEH